MSFKQCQTTLAAKPPLQGPNIVRAVARNHTPAVVEEIRFQLYSMLKNLSKIIVNILLYKLCEAEPEMNNFLFRERPSFAGVHYAFSVCD